MKIFDFVEKQYFEVDQLESKLKIKNELCIICDRSEIVSLQSKFDFDDFLIQECTNNHNDVRYSNRDHYEFIGLVVNELVEDGNLTNWEIDMFVAKKYLIVVLPDSKDHTSDKCNLMFDVLLQTCVKNGSISKVLYEVLHTFVLFSSVCLEDLEERLEKLQDHIIHYVNKDQFQAINHLRKMTYTIRKHLRVTTYVSEEILVNENEIFSKSGLTLIRDADYRLRKLYSFSESLYDFSNKLLDSYDSRQTMKTNDAITKLTIFTLFFGPLTVITGIYGMNFVHMPELKWQYGYPLAIGLMICVTLTIYFLLKRKKWL